MGTIEGAFIYELINNELIPEEKIDTGIGFSRKTFLHLIKQEKNIFTGISDVETPYINFKIRRDKNPNIYHINDVSKTKVLRTESWLRFEKQFKPNKELKGKIVSVQVEGYKS